MRWPRREATKLTTLRARYSWPKLTGSEPGPHGPQRNRALIHRMLSGRETIILEIGTAFGRSALDFVERCPKATVICLGDWDPSSWTTFREAPRPEYEADPNWLWNAFLANTSAHRGRLIPMRTSPKEGLRELSALGLSPDFIYCVGKRPHQKVLSELDQVKTLFPDAKVAGHVNTRGAGGNAVGDFAHSLDQLVVQEGLQWGALMIEPNRRHPLIVSVHVPKTAGTSFGGVLTQAFKRQALLNYSPQTLVGRRIRCVHGHFAPRGRTPCLQALEPVVWLRDPVDRVVSHYHYWRRQPDLTNPACKSMINEGLSLVEFASMPYMRNRQTVFAGGLDIEDYTMIGLTEEFSRGVELFRKIFAIGRTLKPTFANQAPEAAWVTAHELRKLRELNSEDAELYRLAGERFSELCRRYL